MKLALTLAVIFTASLVAPLGLMLWGFFIGDTAAVLVGAFAFSLGAVLSVPFVWAFSGGEK
jgi:hypothetical protein